MFTLNLIRDILLISDKRGAVSIDERVEPHGMNVIAEKMK